MLEWADSKEEIGKAKVTGNMLLVSSHVKVLNERDRGHRKNCFKICAIGDFGGTIIVNAKTPWGRSDWTTRIMNAGIFASATKREGEQ